MILDAKKDNHVELVIDGLKNEVITEAEVTVEFKKAILDDGVYMFCKYFTFNKENAQFVADNIGRQEDTYASVIDWIDDAAQTNRLPSIDETLLKDICKNTVIAGINGSCVFYAMPPEWAKIIITELVKKIKPLRKDNKIIQSMGDMLYALSGKRNLKLLEHFKSECYRLKVVPRVVSAYISTARSQHDSDAYKISQVFPECEVLAI